MAFSFVRPKGLEGKTPKPGEGADTMDMSAKMDGPDMSDANDEGKEPASEKATEIEMGSAILAAIASKDPNAVYEAIMACK